MLKVKNSNVTYVMAAFQLEVEIVIYLRDATHSSSVKNLTKVWKTETGPSQAGWAWSRGPESELFEILPYRDH